MPLCKDEPILADSSFVCHLFGTVFFLSKEVKNCYTCIHMAKIVPTRPLFIMLYGFPGSGKTYFARQLCEQLQAAHVQSDRIRAELFEQPRYDKQENAIVAQITSYMSSEFLSAGVSVVYDSNAMRAAQRHAMREMARRHHAQPLLVWFQMDMESAFGRAMKRDRRRADDRYAMPMDRSTFESIVNHMQNPALTEDYIVVSGKHPFATQLSATVNRMREMGLIHLDEASQKMVKPGMVNLVPNPSQAGRVDMSRRNIIIR